MELLASVPDVPRWLELRALLLSPESEVLGGGEGSVVVHRAARLIGIVGTPAAGTLRAAILDCSRQAVIVADPAQVELITGLLPGAIVRRAWRFAFRRESLPLATALPGKARPLSGDELRRIQDLPSDLEESLLRASGMADVVAAFAGSRPVSFASVNWETETLSDLYTETLTAFRARGYAAACLARMVRETYFRGKLPTGLVECTNYQSLALVKKLGGTRIGACCLIDGVLPE